MSSKWQVNVILNLSLTLLDVKLVCIKGHLSLFVVTIWWLEIFVFVHYGWDKYHGLSALNCYCRVRVGFVPIIGKISAGVTDKIIMGWQLTGKRIPIHVHVGSLSTWPSSKEQNIFAYHKLWYGNIAHILGVSFNNTGEYSSDWARKSDNFYTVIWLLSILHLLLSRLLVVLIPSLSAINLLVM